MRKLLLTCIFPIFLFGCENAHLPKPKGYNRIDLPEQNYQELDGDYAYTFEYSAHSKVEPDSFNLQEKNWINLNYSDFNAKVHLTYKKNPWKIRISIAFRGCFQAYGPAPNQSLRNRRVHSTHTKWLHRGRRRTQRRGTDPVSVFRH